MIKDIKENMVVGGPGMVDIHIITCIRKYFF